MESAELLPTGRFELGSKLTLMIGAREPKPASEQLIRALSSVEVTCGDQAPAGFQLTFEAARYDPRYTASDRTSQKEWPLLVDDTISPFSRVRLQVELAKQKPQTLIDGCITRIELNLESEADQPVLVATGEDLSVKMDLFEISAEYQNLAPSAVARQILGQYSSLFGAQVVAPPNESTPADYVMQQNSTDRFYVEKLAARIGYVFYLQPAAKSGQKSTAYWGPEVAGSSPDLVAEMGKRTNVLSLAFTYDALAPTVTYASVLDLSKYPAEVAQVAASRYKPRHKLAKTGVIPSSPSPASLAKNPSSSRSQASRLALRGSLVNEPGQPLTRVKAITQGRTNRSADDAITVEGELDTEVYGNLLASPGQVTLLGVGTKYGGTYAVREVVHSFELKGEEWSHRQKFRLGRGGIGFK